METRKSEPKETKKRKGTSCIGCKRAKKISDHAYACTATKPDMKDFTCYE